MTALYKATHGTYVPEITAIGNISGFVMCAVQIPQVGIRESAPFLSSGCI